MTDDANGTTERARSTRGRGMRRARRAALALCGAGAFAGAATAQTGYVGILGGGPVYKHIPGNVRQLETSGFNELIVWSVEVNASGDLNLNGEFPLTSAGVFVGAASYPDFHRDLERIKQGTPTRVTFSIGSSNFGDWEDIKALVDAQGTGPDSILYKDFAALKAALPVDAIDFDDENSYDPASTVKFAVMLGRLGYKVTMNPYTNYGILEVGGVGYQHKERRPGGRHSPADLRRGRGQQPLRLGVEFRRRAGFPRHIGPNLGPALQVAGADRRRRCRAGTASAASSAAGCGSTTRSRGPARWGNTPARSMAASPRRFGSELATPMAARTERFRATRRRRGRGRLGCVAVRGARWLDAIAGRLQPSATSVISEFNEVREGKVILRDHSVCLRHALLGVSEEELAAVAPIGYRAEDFQSRYFDYAPPYGGDPGLWVLSYEADAAPCLFRHNTSGMIIPYRPMKPGPRGRDETVTALLEAEFTPFTYDEAEFSFTMRLIFAQVPAGGALFVIKAAETRRAPDGTVVPHAGRRRLNQWCAQAARLYPGVRLVDLSEFADGEDVTSRPSAGEAESGLDEAVAQRLCDHMLAETLAGA